MPNGPPLMILRLHDRAFDPQKDLTKPKKGGKPDEEEPVGEHGGPERPPADAHRVELYYTKSSPGCWYVFHGGRWYRICT